MSKEYHCDEPLNPQITVNFLLPSFVVPQSTILLMPSRHKKSTALVLSVMLPNVVETIIVLNCNTNRAVLPIRSDGPRDITEIPVILSSFSLIKEPIPSIPFLTSEDLNILILPLLIYFFLPVSKVYLLAMYKYGLFDGCQ